MELTLDIDYMITPLHEETKQFQNSEGLSFERLNVDKRRGIEATTEKVALNR